jgi:hypothetical protein
VALLRIGGLITALTVGAAGWALNAAEHDDTAWPRGVAPIERPEINVDGSTRRAMLARAQVRLLDIPVVFDLAANPADPGGTLSKPSIECRFLAKTPSGTTPKFDCMLADGEVVRVKYGRNPELHAEAAATRLLAALGYPADRVYFVPRLRCHGCPRHPFLAMHFLAAAHVTERFPPNGWSEGFTDFEWAAVERRFDGAAVVTGSDKGWSWWELKTVDPTKGASRAALDALRLLAVFLAHWDNKASNQRLVCTTEDCATPLLMLQDLGSTFGPSKVNLARWQVAPIWLDRRQCTATMRSLPYGGATFRDVTISEGGRQTLLQALESIPIEQVRALFRGARFPEFYSGTDDEQDVEAWSEAFTHRVQEIAAGGPCPEQRHGTSD